MPVQVSYPGVYVQELPGSPHVIPGVSTSDTAFVDIFRRGPVNVATRVGSFGEFTATFGDLAAWSRASYGLYQFFLNGGSVAWVVRVQGDSEPASLVLDDLDLTAIGPGTWGNSLQAAVQQSTGPVSASVDSAGRKVFDLVVRENGIHPTSLKASIAAREIYRGLSLTEGDPNFVVDVIAHNSALVRAKASRTDEAPTAQPSGSGRDNTAGANVDNPEFSAFQAFTRGSDGSKEVTAADLIGDPGDPAAESPTEPTGIYPLAHMAPEGFNILCLPATSRFSQSAFQEAFSAASRFCEDQRAFLIVDTPAALDGENPGTQIEKVKEWFGTVPVANETDHAAVYFPRLVMPDPGGDGSEMSCEASGTVAGIYARTDAARGVWKPPAGTQATLTGAKPAFSMNDSDNGLLNELGINVLRSFPVIGSVVWGARTVRGADSLDSQWKYVPTRRLALHIETSLWQGTQWAVFEPNEETLWSALRLDGGSFMATLNRQGAFAGASPKDAYFVQCDSSTTTPVDQADGVVNLVVGFAPDYPAEFVVLQISLIAAA